ncbi:hypothetical protein CAPTEDRAFT_214544 [Capitella teleta]|uniref:Reverse transcriptase domain-containing protein n=1 Tax=Capitella teleta TaxID=283909 RepID=R7TWC3_CAPTE|nr:hypothetical protein CAPTEDRAFT_214544 [Capitella teleta]|eukprot:ELT95741.1 hypothetical protein CAPTEDRAFT_214544 [Capitella teleta]
MLGPFLFLIYINDLPNSSSSIDFITYADDTTLITSLNSNFSTNSLNNELNNVFKWFCTNKLSLNATKTNSITFHTPQRKITPPDLYINSHKIQNVDHTNFLGIIIDKHLSFKPHINKIFEKLLLKQLYKYFTDNSLLFNHQYGFRKGHSTEHAVLELVDRVEILDSLPADPIVPLSPPYDDDSVDDTWVYELDVVENRRIVVNTVPCLGSGTPEYYMCPHHPHTRMDTFGITKDTQISPPLPPQNQRELVAAVRKEWGDNLKARIRTLCNNMHWIYLE